MRFIGQKHIMRELYPILRELYERDVGVNFLLRGPSGYGKTTMALSICEFLAGKNFRVYWANPRMKVEDLVFDKRVVFIDEIHKFPDHESLYAIMDSGKHVLVFATNQDSVLPEAFSNRCYKYIFDDYSDEALILIAMESADFSTSDENFLHIIEAGNRNPRIIKQLIDKFGFYFKQFPNVNPRTADYKKILEEVFSIQDGLDTLCRRYMEVLQDVGGVASLSLLKNILHVDEGTLTDSVEPVLIRKKLVRITKKGRTIYDSI